MKKILTSTFICAIIVFSVLTMDNPQLPQRRTIKRINSQVLIPFLKDKENLPIMSVDTYLNMMKKFLADNSEFLNYDEWIRSLRINIGLIDDGLTKAMARFPATKSVGSGHLEGVTVADFSCPKMVASAQARLTADTAMDPTSLPENIALEKGHLSWILSHFKPYLENIQKHEANADDKYDSGLKDEDIDLLIKLTVGKQRLFKIDTLSEEEKVKFIDSCMRVMLRNATGFQRVISLLVVSVLNREDKCQFEQINVHFIKGSKGSYKQYKDVHINEADSTGPLDESLFHEITHSFHHMLGFIFGRDELISNIAIMNSPDVNLIEQFFPMLRPTVMFPAVERIKNIIDKYYGIDFEKINKVDKEKLIVVVLEPILRNIVVSGFGSLIYPDYTTETTQSLKVTDAMLTSENMARGLYLSLILNDSILAPYINDRGEIIIPTNITQYADKEMVAHSQFKEMSVTPKMIQKPIKDEEIFGLDNLWNTAEEKLCMQGSVLYPVKTGLIYVQDKQHEQIYRVRSDKHDSSIPLLYRYRVHQDEYKEFALSDKFNLINKCISSVEKVSFMTINTSLDKELDLYSILQPSDAEKYSTSDKISVKRVETKVDDELYNTWKSAIYNGYQCNYADKENIARHDKLVAQMIVPLIKEGLKVNVANKFENTPLIIAVQENFVETVKLLVENGADVNFQRNNGETILHCAALSDLPFVEDIMDILFAHGANPNIKDSNGWTPLHLAARYATKNAILKLLQNKADINAKNHSGNTPLHEAIRRGKDILKLLIDNGADINATNHNQKTPLWSVVYDSSDPNTKIEVLKFLLENKAQTDTRDNSGNTILHCLVYMYGENKDKRQLLTFFIDDIQMNIDCLNYKGNTPLHCAVANNELDIVKFLVEKNAKIDTKNYDGLSPLELAIKQHRNEISEFLVTRIDINSKYAEEIFRFAALKNNTDIMRFLIQKGINVNTQDANRDTAMHLAIQNCVQISKDPLEINKKQKIDDITDVLKMVLQNDGNPGIKNKQSKMPIDLVLKEGSIDIKLISFQMDFSQNELQLAHCYSDIDQIQKGLSGLNNDFMAAFFEKQLELKRSEMKKLQQAQDELKNNIRSWGDECINKSLEPEIKPVAHMLFEKLVEQKINEAKESAMKIHKG